MYIPLFLKKTLKFALNCDKMCDFTDNGKNQILNANLFYKITRSKEGNFERVLYGSWRRKVPEKGVGSKEAKGVGSKWQLTSALGNTVSCNG